jgi:hypothetical protein
LKWFGYSADLLRFDFKYADFGFAGSFDGVRRVSGDPEREARDRATIAALAPCSVASPWTTARPAATAAAST